MPSQPLSLDPNPFFPIIRYERKRPSLTVIEEMMVIRQVEKLRRKPVV